MQWDFLVNPIFGGIIGYGTNYLAIKMLFRPHNTKYIGRFKIPFTPGLIPKEKATLARQMGEITEEYLLTEEMLVDTLTNAKAKQVFINFTNSIPSYMEESQKSIYQVGQDLLGKDLEDKLELMTHQLSLEIIKLLGSRQVTDRLVPYLLEQISQMINDYIEDEANNRAMVHSLQEFGQNALESHTAKEYLHKGLGQLEDKTYSLLRENASHIGKGIIGALGQGQEAAKIKETLQHWMDENFNPMVSMFIKVDKIYDGIISFASQALDDPERTSKFADLLCLVMKDLLNNPALLSSPDQDDETDYKNKLINLLKDQVNPNNISILLETVIEELREQEASNKVKMTQWAYSQWDQYLKTPECLRVCQGIVRELIERISTIPLANLAKLMTKDTSDKINEKLFYYYTQLMEKNSDHVAQVMDISNLVENKINEFSSQEAEKVILSVVKNQLRGITWIGAILGAIIGLLSNFI